MKWTVHGRRTLYESDWVNVTIEDVKIPGGRRLEHHVLRMPRESVAATMRGPRRVVLSIAAATSRPPGRRAVLAGAVRF